MKLEVVDIRKSFEGNEVLHGVSFSLESGKALGLLGRNGAGKTTTIRILMDVFKASSGNILLDGKPFVANKYKIGYLPEERGMYPKKKVCDQLIYFAGLKGISRKQAEKNGKELLEKLGIGEYYNRKLETLSKGNQQKVQLVQTLISNPDIIILDEPFSGLDPVNSQMLKDLVTEEIEKGKMVIFSSHQMGYVEEFCEHIVIINKGEVSLAGQLSTIKKDMGKEKGILSINGLSVEETAEYCKVKLNQFISDISIKKDFIVFSYKVNKLELLDQFVKQNVDVEVFGDYKPTLTDIFVKVAGE